MELWIDPCSHRAPGLSVCPLSGENFPAAPATVSTGGLIGLRKGSQEATVQSPIGTLRLTVSEEQSGRLRVAEDSVCGQLGEGAL